MSAAASAVTARAVGPLAVWIDRADAVALARAVDPDATGDTVPLIFPIRWLALPEIHAALAELVDLSGAVLVHEAQGFSSVVPLFPDTNYVLEARLTCLANAPIRVAVTGMVSDRAGKKLGELHATLLVLHPRATQ